MPASLVLSICMGIPLWATILLVGAVTIVYDTIGGISAVVYSDVIQMGILLAGVIACVWVAAGAVGGLGEVFSLFPAERLRALDMSTGFGDSDTPFWGFLIGGLFLYASYYGVDQSQVQRELSAKSLEDTRRSLVFNGIARFPLTLAYVLLGIAASALYFQSAELRAAVPDDQLDALIPNLILLHLPQGVRAVVIAAILAAAMSSIDSGLNSLSAATVRDFIERGRELPQRQLFIMSKVTTVVWGVVITAFAFAVGSISDTVLEGINKIGSLFYGPILAAFIMGILSKRAQWFGDDDRCHRGRRCESTRCRRLFAHLLDVVERFRIHGRRRHLVEHQHVRAGLPRKSRRSHTVRKRIGYQALATVVPLLIRLLSSDPRLSRLLQHPRRLGPPIGKTRLGAVNISG